MRLALALASAFPTTLALALLAPPALAAHEATLPPSGGEEALTVSVDPAGHAVSFTAGEKRGQVAVDLEDADPAGIAVAPVALGDGRQVVHVRIPSRGRPGVAWEAILAGHDPAVLWSGMTGLATGEEGERAGEALDLPEEAGGFVVLGEVREDLHICGQPRTLLSPRVLDPRSMTFRGATMQQLPEERREGAEQVVASALPGPLVKPLAPLLLATGASTAIGAPAALTDGDPATTWSEGRPGDGHGEFVTLRAAAGVPIARLAITPIPARPAPHSAAPRTFYLVTDTRTIQVTLPEDAWMHPGATYDVPLVEPLRASCVSLVLDKAYARPREAHPEVTIAELTAYSELDHPGATDDEVAKALAGGGARAMAAKGILERAGDAGLVAAAAAYPSLDAAGRALAVDAAIGAGTCEASAPLLLAAMGDADPEVARKGTEKLERCGKRATPALLAALRGEVKGRAVAARWIAAVAPGEALDPLAGALAGDDASTRGAVRSALARAARGVSAGKLAALVGDAGRGADDRVELLRAFADRLGEIPAEADRVIASLAEGAPFARRYRLVAPIAALARAGDAAAAARLAALIGGDPDAAIRAHAAEEGKGVEGARGALVAAIDDPAPRVREAALRAISGATRASPVEAASRALAHDTWTFVRAAAAAALASFPADPRVDDSLVEALGDRSPTVRAEAIAALASRGARRAEKPIRAIAGDKGEALETRIAAVRALATLCDRDAIDPLTTLARDGALPLATDEDIVLSLEAVNALGSLHPPDLASRLAPLSAKDASATARGASARALATAPGCR